MSESIEKLTELFSKFPGIGPRQARRFAYFLLSQDQYFINSLSQRISQIKNTVSRCSTCFRHFSPRKDETTCEVCRDPNKDKSILIIVEREIDLDAVLKTLPDRKRFFVLGGSVPLLEKTPEKRIRLSELKNKIEEYKKDGLSEIILALSANPTGDHTGDVVKEALSPLIEGSDLRISLLGRGLSTGTELEYSDQDTLKAAFENRH